MFRTITLSAIRISEILKLNNKFGIVNGPQPLRQNSYSALREICRNKLVFIYYPLRFFCQNSEENNQNSAKEKVEKEETAQRVNNKDRSIVILPETSIRYLKSKAYHETYQGKPVWFFYRRNYKGGMVPRTRKTCIRKKMISTGSPCPICRDEYLVLDYTNVELLKQFICPQTGEVYSTKKTGLCQTQQGNLLLAIEKAKDCGFITFEIPFRKYIYEEFYPQLKTSY